MSQLFRKKFSRISFTTHLASKSKPTQMLLTKFQIDEKEEMTKMKVCHVFPFLHQQQKALIEKQQEKEKKRLEDFREMIQQKLHEFVKDSSLEKLKLEPMDKVSRSIVHEVADIAGLASFSFGIEEEDRYVMLWKKEFAPSDEELLAYRKDEEWDPEKAKQILKQREEDRLQSQIVSLKQKGITPQRDYKDKYRHLIGDTSAKEAAQSTKTDRSYGFVSSENKRDHRTIEQVMADSKAKKKQKLEHFDVKQSDNSNSSLLSVVSHVSTSKDTEKVCSHRDTNLDTSGIVTNSTSASR